MASNADKIREYFRRQYETEEGTVEENIEALFSKDLVYHVGEGKTLTREAIVQTGRAIRSTPKAERVAAASGFREEGDVVFFHMSVRAKDAESGDEIAVDSDHKWRFGADGKVVEAWPAETKATEEAFREAGIEPD